MKLKRYSRYYYLRLKRLKGSPYALARAFAMGAAIGITPTLPFHSIMILCTSILFRLNFVAAIIAGAIVSNPFTFVPHYYAAWWLGNLFFPGRLNWLTIKQLLFQMKEEGIWESMHTLYDVGFNTFIVMLTGGVLLGLIAGTIAYFLSLRFFLAIAQKKRERRALNKKK